MGTQRKRPAVESVAARPELREEKWCCREGLNSDPVLLAVTPVEGMRGKITKRHVIDPSGLMAPDAAREIAKELLVEIGQGGDPARERAQGKLRTVAALIDGFEKSREEKGRRSAG